MSERKWTNDQLIDAIKMSKFWQDIPKKLGLKVLRISKSIKNAIKKLKLDTSHLSRNKFHSEKSKKLMSIKRKEWCKENVSRHNWQQFHKNKESLPEKVFKEALLFLKISATQYYTLPDCNRYFEIDFALIGEKIAFEVNGNQHYENGKLAPYYQERHDYLTKLGWTVHEIHYYECLKLERAKEVINKCINECNVEYSSSPEIINYRDKKKELKIIETENKYVFDLQILDIINIHKLQLLINNIDNVYLIQEIDIINSKANYGRQWSKGLSFPEKWKIEHPSKEELEKLVWEIPTKRVAKIFGVSDHTVAKWCRKAGISKPPRGYWEKKQRNKILGIRICDICNNEYGYVQLNQKFCSIDCSRVYKNKKRRKL